MNVLPFPTGRMHGEGSAKNPVAMGALVVLGLLVIMVIIGPHIRGYDYINMNVVEKNQGPSGKYWFGTDSLGRDLFSRVWVGARASVIIAPGGHSSENGDRYPVRRPPWRISADGWMIS